MAWLEQMLGIPRDDIALFVAALAAFFVIYTVGMSLMERDRFSKRVKQLRERQDQLRADARGPKKRQKVTAVEQDRAWIRQIVTRFKLLQSEQAEKLQKQLVNAGYRSKDAIFIYSFCQAVFPILFLLLGLLLADIDYSNILDSIELLLIPLIAGFIGAKLPSVLVNNARNKRYLILRRSIPDTLDLMMICAEAGLSLGAALTRVAKELNITYPEMADELALTAVEMGLLPDRKKALKNLVWRNDMEEIRGIVNVLLQTEKYGTPIAQALRVLSADYRTERMLAAEQKAARLPALMTVPMIMFILPTLFIVLITPAVIGVLDAME